MKTIEKYKYFGLAIFAIVIFVLGMVFANSLWKNEIIDTETDLDRDTTELRSMELQLIYLQSESVKSCDLLELGLQDTMSDYNENLKKVQNYNSTFNRERYRLLKKRYVLSGIMYWIFAEDLREKCDFNATTALFFTESLDEESRNECESKVTDNLDSLKEDYGDGLLVFTVPMEMDLGMADVLEKQYEVEDVPLLVFNGNNTISGCPDREEIEAEL
ncbi:MAG: hypothetical protein ACLFS3_01170 [Candidatus Aenigmatarchaeota archaeon]